MRKNDDKIKQLQSLEKLKMAENIIKKTKSKLENINSVTTVIAARLTRKQKKIIEDVNEISVNLQLHNQQFFSSVLEHSREVLQVSSCAFPVQLLCCL